MAKQGGVRGLAVSQKPFGRGVLEAIASFFLRLAYAWIFYRMGQTAVLSRRHLCYGYPIHAGAEDVIVSAPCPAKPLWTRRIGGYSVVLPAAGLRLDFNSRGGQTAVLS